MTEVQEKKWIWGVSLFYLCFFLKIVYFQFLALRVQAIDFSLFDFMLENTARGNFMSCIKGINHFGVHSTPILFLLYPLHRLFHSPLYLLFTHAVILWSAFFPLWKLTRRHLSVPLFRFLVVFSFFNFNYLFQVLEYNFHMEAFYVPLFLWLFYFNETKNAGLFWVTTLLILSVKEDAALYVAATGIAIVIVEKKTPKGLLLALLSGFVFWLNTRWIIPYNSPDGHYHMADAASAYGNSLGDIVANISKHPLPFIRSILFGKWISIAGNFLFVPLVSPFVLIGVAPFAAIHALAHTYVMQNIMLYYSAPYIPFLFYGWILFIGRYRWPLVSKPLPVLAKTVVVFAITMNLTLIGGSYLVVRPQHPDYKNLKSIKQTMDLNQTMCVQGVLIPPLGYPRSLQLLSFPCLDQGLHYYVIDSNLDAFDLFSTQLKTIRERLDSDKRYLKRQEGGVVLYERKT